MLSSWLWQGTTALDVERLRGWLQALPGDVFRVKGLAQGNKSHWLQHVGTCSQFLPPMKRWPALRDWCLSLVEASTAGKRWGRGLRRLK